MNELKLWQIPQAIQSALDAVQLDEETGELLNVQALRDIEGLADQKLASTAMYLREREALIALRKETIKQLSASIEAEEHRIEKLKTFMLEIMWSAEIKKVEAPAITVQIKKNPPKLVIDHPEDVPPSFIEPEHTVTVPAKINKVALKRYLSGLIKSGVSAPSIGAHLEQSDRIEFK